MESGGKEGGMQDYRDYEEAFRAAEEQEDYVGMLSVYEKTWVQSANVPERDQIAMSRSLMELCPAPGLHHRGMGREIPIFGQDTEALWPEKIYKAYPIEKIRTGDRFLDSPNVPFRDSFFEDEKTIRWYFTYSATFGRPSVDLRECIWDKEKESLLENIIPLRLQGTFVRRIIAVSSLGNFLILEIRNILRENMDDKERETGRIVCVTNKGNMIGEILDYRSYDSPASCFLEDRIHGPDRGYLWFPNTSRVWYFEASPAGFHTWPWERAPVGEGRAFPMPGRLFYEKCGPSHKRTGEVIKSMFLSVDGLGMALVTSCILEMRHMEEEQQNAGRTILFYRRGTGKWGRIEFGSPRRFLVSRDISFFMAGKQDEAGWYYVYRLYPAAVNHKQKPLFELKSKTGDREIYYFSRDLNTLLDQKGRPVYDLCWKFQKGIEKEEKK